MSYRDLAAKVDAFFDRVAARHGDQMDCATGCSDCCRARLTVTPVEAAAIAELIPTLSDDVRRVLAGTKARPTADPDVCHALIDGRCAIYAARPMVCRSHGAPVRMRDPDNAKSLPIVQVCERNFRAAGPASADADCIIDQTTLSALLLAVHRAAGADPQAREDLAALLVRLTE